MGKLNRNLFFFNILIVFLSESCSFFCLKQKHSYESNYIEYFNRSTFDSCRYLESKIRLGSYKNFNLDTLYFKGNLLYGKIRDLTIPEDESIRFSEAYLNREFRPKKNFKIYSFQKSKCHCYAYSYLTSTDNFGEFKLKILHLPLNLAFVDSLNEGQNDLYETISIKKF